MSDASATPDPQQLGAARNVLHALTRAPGSWPSNDPILAESDHTVPKLLRAGADVVATTRFPKDAARWFTTSLAQQVSHLDIFVANAAQTVRRPPAYYHALVACQFALASLPVRAKCSPQS